MEMEDVKENITPHSLRQPVQTGHNNAASSELKRNAPRLKSILCKRRKTDTIDTLDESGTSRRVRFTSDVKTSSPISAVGRKQKWQEKYPTNEDNVSIRNTRSTSATHESSKYLSPTAFYQPLSMLESSSENDGNTSSVELSDEARKQVQLLTLELVEVSNESEGKNRSTIGACDVVFPVFKGNQIKVKALQQENESLRERIVKKRVELVYLLQQRPCPTLPHIMPSTYSTSDDGDTFHIIGETLNMLFID